MLEGVLASEDTGIEIKNKESTSASPVIFGGGYSWPSLSYGNPALRFDNLRGHILSWLEKYLNLDDDKEYDYYYSVDKQFRSSVDDIQRAKIKTNYTSGYFWISDSHPTWKHRFEQLMQLPTNWDSYGAPRISNKALNKGKSILTVMTYIGFSQQFFIAPTSDGGIEIEWELPGKELILEIPPTGKLVSYLLVEIAETGEEVETEGTISNKEGLAQLLKIIGV